MKCPKCTLVTSNKRDLCPRCHFDLRTRKRELSIPVTNPGATVEQLLKIERTQDDGVRASAVAALNAGPAPQAASPAKSVKKKKKRKKSEPKPTFWQKLLASLFPKKAKEAPEPTPVQEEKSVEPPPIIALPVKRYRVKGKLVTVRKKKITGFHALYLRYLYLLRGGRRKKLPPKLPFSVKREVIHLERYEQQFKYLLSSGITTETELEQRIRAGLMSATECIAEEIRALAEGKEEKGE